MGKAACGVIRSGIAERDACEQGGTSGLPNGKPMFRADPGAGNREAWACGPRGLRKNPGARTSLSGRPSVMNESSRFLSARSSEVQKICSSISCTSCTAGKDFRPAGVIQVSSFPSFRACSIRWTPSTTEEWFFPMNRPISG